MIVRRVLGAMALVAVLAGTAAADTRYVPPPVYDHLKVTVVSREITHRWDLMFIKLMIANHTGKEITLDFNQIYCQRVDNSTVARESSIIPSKNKPVTIAPGLSYELALDYKVGKKPEPLELILNKAFLVNGKPLNLPNYEMDPVGDPKLIKLKKDKIELTQKVHFDTDKSKIMGDSFAMLDEVALAMRVRPSMRVRIEGHTDDRGNEQHNMKLSQARADAVRAYLANKKVTKERMESTGYGASKPIAKGEDEAAREQNRRVEFYITAQ